MANRNPFSVVTDATALAERVLTGPRYTSYPPATCFSDMSPAQLAPELATLAQAHAAISLYLHIPYCQKRCWYCGCNVVISRDRNRAQPYVQELLAEADLLVPHLPGARITELVLGGGSPNVLTPEVLNELMTGLAQRFALDAVTRRSVEFDPRTTELGNVAAWARHGFRAASMGVQDFAENVQAAIGRMQSVEVTAGLMAELRHQGFSDVNVDLVYGLPNQTPASLSQTLEHVIAMQPDRIAVFGYAHLPQRHPWQKLVEQRGALPNTQARAELLVRVNQALTLAGYQPIGIDHFARPGSPMAKAADEQRLMRSFQGYVERQADAVIGLGASAISTTPRAIWQNHIDLPSWEGAVRRGEVPVARGVALTLDDQVRRDVISDLMCYGEVDLTHVAARYGLEARTYFATELAHLHRDPEIVQIHDASHTLRLVTTALGRVLARNVCQRFDRRAAAGGTFSSTV